MAQFLYFCGTGFSFDFLHTHRRAELSTQNWKPAPLIFPSSALSSSLFVGQEFSLGGPFSLCRVSNFQTLPFPVEKKGPRRQLSWSNICHQDCRPKRRERSLRSLERGDLFSLGVDCNPKNPGLQDPRPPSYLPVKPVPRGYLTFRTVWRVLGKRGPTSTWTSFIIRFAPHPIYASHFHLALESSPGLEWFFSCIIKTSFITKGYLIGSIIVIYAHASRGNSLIPSMKDTPSIFRTIQRLLRKPYSWFFR